MSTRLLAYSADSRPDSTSPTVTVLSSKDPEARAGPLIISSLLRMRPSPIALCRKTKGPSVRPTSSAIRG